MGQQAIAEVFGAKLKNLEQVYHGVASPIQVINSDPLFANCPATFEVGRYHSWVVDPETIPNELEITAIDNQKNIMALRHKTYDIKTISS